MNANLIINPTVLESISEIISNLSELYHHAAIVSYLDNMEGSEYRDGVDAPQELRVHVSHIEYFARSIKEQVNHIAGLVEFDNQNLSRSMVLQDIASFDGLWGWTGSHKEWGDHVIGTDNGLMEKVDHLRNNLINFLSQVNAELQKSISLSFQKLDMSKRNLDDIKRNPQASIQHAFILLEDQIRNKINAGSDLIGEALINAAFGNNGCLVYGRTPAEQLGVRNFISGAYATFRNPRMHREIKDNEHEALQLLTMIDLIMVIVEKAVVK